MNRTIGILALIVGLSSTISAKTARAEASPSGGSTAIGSTTPGTVVETPAVSAEDQSYINMGASNAQQQVQTINANSTPVPSTFQPPATGGNGSAGSAKKAQTMQLIVTGASVAAAGYLATQCFKTPPSPMACPMMALAIAQAGMSLASSGGSGKSAQQFSTSSGYGTGGSTTGSPGADNTMGNGTMGANGGSGADGGVNTNDPQQMAINSQMGKLVGEYNSLRGTLEKSGYKVSADGQTVTDPQGRKIPASAFANGPAGAASALGLSDSDAAAMNEAMKGAAAKANERVKGIAMAVEGGGGSGVVANASGGGGSGRGGFGGGGFNFRMPGQGGSQVKGVSGLSKQLGSDKIGIASDNIFEMIHHRYQERDKDGNFQKQ